MTRVAALPMYEVDRTAVEAWWRGIASALRDEGLADVPASLTWSTDLPLHWRDPALLLSQTCGCPLSRGLGDAVQVVGAFRYTAPGCQGIAYRSAFVSGEHSGLSSIDALRGRVVAINSEDSLSGWHALRAELIERFGADDLLAEIKHSGSHRASLAMLRRGEASLAAIDCVTLELLRRHAPDECEGLRVIGHSAARPGLPLISSIHTSADELAALRRALAAACADPALQATRDALLIASFEPVDASAWASVRALCR